MPKKPKIRIARDGGKTMRIVADTKNAIKPKEKSSVELTATPGKVQNTYKSADVRTGAKSYGKEKSDGEAPEFVKKAQEEKKEVVNKNGKSYRAGYTVSDIEKPKLGMKIKTGITVNPVKQVEMKSSTAMHDTGGARAGKRRLERVDWLKGRNKRTESGYGG